MSGVLCRMSFGLLVMQLRNDHSLFFQGAEGGEAKLISDKTPHMDPTVRFLLRFVTIEI